MVMQTLLLKAAKPDGNRFFSCGGFIFLFLFCFAPVVTAHAAETVDIGKIIILVPGVSVTRDGQTEALRQHSPVRVSDRVNTDATGRVRILFNDDSTVDMGGNTSLDMREFADSGVKPVFNVHLLQGVARVITGKIVEQNPGGFAVSTPEGTIGIRGTIISVRSGNGVTTVYVENTTRAVYVNNINVPGGQKITIPADPVRPEPILPQDRRNLGRDLAFRGGTGVAAAAPEPYQGSGQPEEQLRGATTAVVAEADLIPPDSPLADVSLPMQSLGDSLIAGGGGGPVTAFVSGTLASTVVGGTFSGNFSFSADLSSGAISGGTLTGSGNTGTGSAYSGAFTVNYYGGSGTATAGPYGFWVVQNFSAGAGTTAAFSPLAATSFVKGPGDLATIPNGGSVPADYGIEDASWTMYDYGTGAGTLTK